MEEHYNCSYCNEIGLLSYSGSFCDNCYEILCDDCLEKGLIYEDFSKCFNCDEKSDYNINKRAENKKYELKNKRVSLLKKIKKLSDEAEFTDQQEIIKNENMKLKEEIKNLNEKYESILKIKTKLNTEISKLKESLRILTK